jgi:hypothetical protein
MTGRKRGSRRHTIARAVASLALAPIALSVPLAAVVSPTASTVEYASSRDANLFS